MYTTTMTRIDRYHLREDRIYFDDYPNISTIFLSPEWFEDFSKPVPVSFWEEVASRTLGFPYRRPGGYLKKIKFEENLVIQKKVDSPEFIEHYRLVFIPHPEQAVPADRTHLLSWQPFPKVNSLQDLTTSNTQTVDTLTRGIRKTPTTQRTNLRLSHPNPGRGVL